MLPTVGVSSSDETLLCARDVVTVDDLDSELIELDEVLEAGAVCEVPSVSVDVIASDETVN